MTYLERLKQKFQNNPLVAWVIVVFIVITSLSALYSSLKPLFHDLTDQQSIPLSIVLEPHDPRFRQYKEDRNPLSNWGGGTQSLYIETREPVSVPNLKYNQENENGWAEFYDKMPLFTQGLLSRLIKSDQVVNLWEIIPSKDEDGTRITVNISYDAVLNSPTALVREWGVRISSVPIPSIGIYDWYRVNGGAYMEAIGGHVQIKGEGDYPINLWLENRDNTIDWAKAKSYKQYLKPGEPLFLDINITHSSQHQTIDNPKPIKAFHIKIYAKVLVKGKEYTVYSKNSLRAVVLNGSNDWHEDSGTIIEDSRVNAYFY